MRAVGLHWIDHLLLLCPVQALEKEANYIKENAQRGEEERREATTRVKVLEKRVAHLEQDLRDSAERANTTTLVHHRGKQDAEKRVLELEQQCACVLLVCACCSLLRFLFLFRFH